MNPQHLDEQMQLWSYVRVRSCSKCGAAKEVSQFNLVSKRFKPQRRSAVCIACELEAARVRQEERRKTPEYRDWLDKSRELRKALKTKYRRQAGGLPRSEYLAQKRAQQEERNGHAQRLLAARKAERRARCDEHVRLWRSCTTRMAKWRYDNDPDYAMYQRLKRWMNKHLRDGKPSQKWSVLLGYTTRQLREHIERQFHDGMGWHNKGQWHVDHIVPASSFDLTTEEGIRACMALTNLRPVWAKVNMSKGAKHEFLL